MTFFQVISNLNHNGTLHEVGSIIEGELAAFETLVKDGVLHVIEGAENLTQAAEILEQEQPTAPEVPEAPKEENTWEAKKDEPVAPATDAGSDADTTAADQTQTGEPEKKGQGFLGSLFGKGNKPAEPAPEDLGKNL